MAFCEWLSECLGYQIRLPTEFEWQQAATGGDRNRRYPWGPEEWDPAREPWRANTNESELGRSTAVGMYPQGASPVGALDMAGTLYEWCLNAFDDPDNVAWPASAQERRAVRGGSWAQRSGLRALRGALRLLRGLPSLQRWLPGVLCVPPSLEPLTSEPLITEALSCCSLSRRASAVRFFGPLPGPPPHAGEGCSSITPRPQAEPLDSVLQSSKAVWPHRTVRDALVPTAPAYAWKRRAAANSACDSPLLSRTRTICDVGCTMVRFPRPALISFTPSTTSFHTSRSASNLANAFPVSFLAIPEGLQQCIQNTSRDVVQRGLSIQGQHPELTWLAPHEVDHPKPSALTRTGALPSKFSHAT